MTIKERLTVFAKSKEKSVRAFEIKAGLTIGYINAIRVSIQPDKLKSIALCYPDLNTGWLMTGEGEILKNTEHKEPTVENDTITIPKEVWSVIKSQADSLRIRDESLQSKDNQIDELIKLIKQQMEEVKKINVQKEENAISAAVGL